jgi:hypothetical protein
MNSPYSLEVNTLLTRDGLGVLCAIELISCGISHDAREPESFRTYDVRDLAAARARVATDPDLEPAATDRVDDFHE